jgi:D-arabinose 1-dehydrogenase-like Zn-dependent alcohol dehydrogenase
MKSLQEITVPKTMMAARLHAIGSPMRIDEIPVPDPRPTDVLVEVKACGVVPNMRRVIGNYFGTNTSDPKLFPPLPAIFGLDPVGIIAKLGDQVTGVRPGDRVYVNPARACGSCRMCRAGMTLDCPDFSFQGYFGRSRKIMSSYPYGGFSQFITAPTTAIVELPDNVSFEDAARLGYLGTAYSAMKKLGVGPGSRLLINGLSGTLGICAAMLALAMGASRILGVARNPVLLDRARRLAPERIHVYSIQQESIEADTSDPLVRWSRELTQGQGVDAVVDCLPPGAPALMLKRAIHCLRRGGHAANVGAVTEPLELDTFWMMTNRISLTGSVWFTTAEGEEIVSMAANKILELTPLDHRVFPLSAINEALASMDSNLDGGFANYVIDPRA